MTSDLFHALLRTPDRWPAVMGILNVTPDSFSDGGRMLDPSVAASAATSMVEAGAAWIDVGGESTRPGSDPVPPDEQIRRVVPVLEKIRNLPAILSIDTTDARVAEAALNSGATVVNDVSAARFDPAMLPLVARRGAGIVLMHMRGTPKTMQDSPTYSDVVADVKRFLAERVAAARAAGVSPEAICVDPGIGFGKTLDHNLALLRHTRAFADLAPVVVGTSRKGFIGTITAEPVPERRAFGTAATVAWAAANGAAAVRVHDVREMVQVVRTIQAIVASPRP